MAKEVEIQTIENSKDIEYIKQTVTSIHEQVTKTNGRVSSLEKWRNILVGAGSVIATILSFVFNKI